MIIEVFTHSGDYCFYNIEDFNKFINKYDDRCIVRCKSVSPIKRINNRELSFMSKEEIKQLGYDIDITKPHEYLFEIQSKKFYDLIL